MKHQSRSEQMFSEQPADRSGDSERDDTGPMRVVAVALLVVVIAVSVAIVCAL